MRSWLLHCFQKSLGHKLHISLLVWVAFSSGQIPGWQQKELQCFVSAAPGWFSVLYFLISLSIFQSLTLQCPFASYLFYEYMCKIRARGQPATHMLPWEGCRRQERGAILTNELQQVAHRFNIFTLHCSVCFNSAALCRSVCPCRGGVLI